VLAAATAHVVLGSIRRLRREILAELERLAHEPFSEPDLEETGRPRPTGKCGPASECMRIYALTINV
jgi:hypothetical protein